MEDRDALEILLEGQFTENYRTHCVDMEDWQSHSYPACNQIHELGILGGSAAAVSESGLDYLGRGNWRSAFRVRDHGAGFVGYIRDDDDDDDHDPGADPSPTFVVLKIYHLADDDNFPFDPRAYEMHRIDAVISQQLTASPYVLDIYGHCGLTGIYELGVGDLEHEARYRKIKKKKKKKGHDDHFQRRNHGRYPLDDSTKLTYAAQIARGLADLHGAGDGPLSPNNKNNNNDGGGSSSNGNDAPKRSATIVHGDIKPENIVLVQRKHGGGEGNHTNNTNSGGGGLVAKLGDFNNSILRKWNRTGSAPCPHYQGATRLSWGLGYKPPEQSAGGGRPLDGSIDVFGVGGVLYYLLVGKDPYFRYPPGEEESAIAAGELPPLPRSLRYPGRKSHKAPGGGGGSATSSTTGPNTSLLLPADNDTDGDADHHQQQQQQQQPLGAIPAAIEAAMAIRPGDRPTAEQLADLLASYL